MARIPMPGDLETGNGGLREPLLDGNGGADASSDDDDGSPFVTKKPGTQETATTAADFLARNISAKAGSVGAAHIAIRMGFMRKVFGILATQLLLTVAISMAVYWWPGARLFVQQQSWLVLVCVVSSLGLLVATLLKAHQFPLNYVLLAAFSGVQSLAISSVVCFYDLDVILEAAFLTTITVLALFAYTLQTRRNLKPNYAVMTAVSFALLAATILQMSIGSSSFNVLIDVLAVGIFCAFIVYDLEALMLHLSPEDYILACISLYLDVLNLFLRLLQLINELNR